MTGGGAEARCQQGSPSSRTFSCPSVTVGPYLEAVRDQASLSLTLLRDLDWDDARRSWPLAARNLRFRSPNTGVCAWGLTALLVSSGCGTASQLQARVSKLEEVTRQAANNGARRCAPRELAMAESHLKFAQLELRQGFPSKAESHLVSAEPSALAALALSPPEYCQDRPEDPDGDGYAGPQDACPAVPENFNGVEDRDGCPEDPDTDGDGLSDSVDGCLLAPEDRDAHLDDDGCPEADNDVDTLPDPEDECPNEPEDPDGYQDGDGCPEPDNDRDSVPDLKDQCPNEIGLSDHEPLGCPEKPALVLVTDCEVKITQQIRFEHDKATVRATSHAVLDAVVDVLKKNPEIKIAIQGHTDNRGSAEYDSRLSERRAAAVLDYIVSKGVDVSRLTSRGYGFDVPLEPNTTAQNRAMNRRVQFLRTEGAKAGCAK